MSEPPLASAQGECNTAGIASTANRPATKPSAKQRPGRWWNSTLAVAVLGGLFYWLALPPVGWWPLAWLAPAAWTPIVTRPKLSGRRPYLKLWLAGYLFWSAAVYWITLPHWSAAIGWFFMAGYLGGYFPAFVLVSRLAVQRLRVPVELAMPVAWVAMELVRARLFTGFLMAALGHTQFGWISLIQISDLVGAYGVSFVVMLVGVCFAQAVPSSNEAGRWRWWRLAPAAFALVAAVAYGRGRLAAVEQLAASVPPSPRIALIQGTLDTQFGFSEDEFREMKRRTYEEYLGLSREVVAEHPGVGLVVWPESMYRTPIITFNDLDKPPANRRADDPEFLRENTYDTARQVGAPLLLALNAEDYYPDRTEWRSASVHVTIDELTGAPTIAARYDKMHPVIFGEYVPLGDVFPWLYDLTPIDGGLTPGESAVAIAIDAGPDTPPLLAAPNICFESVVPHLIRRQILELRAKDREPDVLITQTNDGWFWGSAGLDMHLVCDVFRAVEFRKPLLTAANTGISAWIDDTGRIVAQLPRRKPGTIVAEPRRPTLESAYLYGGDWFATACLAASGLCVLVGLVVRVRAKNGSVVF
ncbi:MAG: apolipoprotein N-acyltransferase [Pirellulales bacterium]